MTMVADVGKKLQNLVLNLRGAPAKLLASFSRRRIVPKDKEIYLPVTLITGQLKGLQTSLLCAYAGWSRVNMIHWSQQIFHKPDFQSIGNQSTPELVFWVKKNYPDCSLVLIENETLKNHVVFQKNHFFVPRFINTAIDISDPLSELCKRSRSGFDRIRRWIHAQNLSYETSHSVEAQNEFYNNMYLPFIRSRYAEGSLILEFQGIFNENVLSEVFLIKKAGAVVAGAVIHYWENRPTLGFLGVKEGHIDDVKRWNTGAAYYFVITEFQKRGIKKLYIGGSPPFLLNGLLFFKMKLLAQIDHEKPYQPSGCVSFHLLKYNNGIRDFLENNPFVYVKEDGKLAAAVWSFSRNESRQKDMENQINQAFRLGLDECHVYAWRKKYISKFLSSNFQGKKIEIHKAEEYWKR